MNIKPQQTTCFSKGKRRKYKRKFKGKLEAMKPYEQLKFGDKIADNKYFITCKITNSDSLMYSYYDSMSNTVEYMGFNMDYLRELAKENLKD